jgi:hypothetical protein
MLERECASRLGREDIAQNPAAAEVEGREGGEVAHCAQPLVYHAAAADELAGRERGEVSLCAAPPPSRWGRAVFAEAGERAVRLLVVDTLGSCGCNRNQHQEFRRILRSHGVHCLTVHQILTHDVDRNLRARMELENFAASRLTYMCAPRAPSCPPSSFRPSIMELENFAASRLTYMCAPSCPPSARLSLAPA